MDRLGGETLFSELLGHPVTAALGADENEEPLGGLGDGAHHLRLVHLVDLDEAMIHRLDR